MNGGELDMTTPSRYPATASGLRNIAGALKLLQREQAGKDQLNPRHLIFQQSRQL